VNLFLMGLNLNKLFQKTDFVSGLADSITSGRSSQVLKSKNCVYEVGCNFPEYTEDE
jgi:hypothetical protein